MKDEIKVIFILESLFQSIIADIITFGLLILCLYVNHNYLGSSWIIEILIVISLLFKGYSYTSKKVKRMTPDEAFKCLDKLLKSRKGEKVD